jgi:predicted SprT family Zn-dependent metalloprotease
MSGTDMQNVSQQSEQPRIYPMLAQHQRQEAWQGQRTIAVLQEWAERFIVEFKLDIPSVVLCIDRLAINCLGHFRMGHNGFGLRGEIAINDRYLGSREPWQMLGTLLHELLHAWQQEHGTPSARNHHNREFRDKALELGLVIDARGVTGYAADSSFKDLLRQAGVHVPPDEIKPSTRDGKGSSKLVKWSCQCTPPVNVRVAVADFKAMCLKCGAKFVKQ